MDEIGSRGRGISICFRGTDCRTTNRHNCCSTAESERGVPTSVLQASVKKGLESIVDGGMLAEKLGDNFTAALASEVCVHKGHISQIRALWDQIVIACRRS